MISKSLKQKVDWDLTPRPETSKEVATQDSMMKVASVLEKPWFPWLVPSSAEWLDNNLAPHMMGVEFGGGLSTGWFCERLKFLHTVECSTNWAMGLMHRISQEPNLNSKWYLHYINCDWNKDSEGNRWYIKNNHHLRNPVELNSMEERLKDIHFEHPVDFCLVDGSVRYETFKKSIELIKDNPGAILCVDNTEKEHRAKYVNSEVPDSWEKLEFVNEEAGSVEQGSKTTIFVVG
jgi:hypothetical protein